jgi:hypothetical protein
MPPAWLEELAVAGVTRTCLRQIMRLKEADVHSIVLYSQSKTSVEATLEQAATELLPLVRQHDGT